MFGNCFAIFLSFLIIERCETKSVSIVVRHQQFFSVEGKELDQRRYIPVSDTHSKQLRLTKTKGDVSERAYPEVKHSKAENQVVDDHDTSDYENELDNTTGEEYDDALDDEDDDGIKGMTLEDFLSNDPEAVYDDVSTDDFDIESISGLKKIFRKRRSAHEQWRNSLPGSEPLQTTEDTEPDVWEEVTDEELERAQMHTYKQVATYLGWTLLSVVFFVVIGICFLRDPIACIFAFGTGCPCCLLCCPCIRSFTDKYLDTKKIVREQMNKYMPGVIVNDDGSLDYYQPTGDELDILAEIIDEMQDK